ncbi:hypothetical protein [Hymenobacter bucti]|uniref:SH3 domain-containing protein n=1 Tax=Hymenobacter bucti TaxID=1844114 RepID=A0ABW4QXZ0_9BACT
MHLLIAFAAFLLPVAAWSQPSFTTRFIHSTTIKLSNSALLYERLADSAAARPALQLRPGEHVVLLGMGAPHWLLVNRSYRDTPNTSITYYLREREARGVEITR